MDNETQVNEPTSYPPPLQSISGSHKWNFAAVSSLANKEVTFSPLPWGNTASKMHVSDYGVYLKIVACKGTRYRRPFTSL